MAKNSKTEFGGTYSRIVNAAALRREKLPQELLAKDNIRAIAWTEGMAAIQYLSESLVDGQDYPEFLVELIESHAEGVAARRAEPNTVPVAGGSQ